MEISRKAVATEISLRERNLGARSFQSSCSCEFNHEIKISSQETWLSHASPQCPWFMCGPWRRVKKLITNGSSVLKRSYPPFRYLSASRTLETQFTGGETFLAFSQKLIITNIKSLRNEHQRYLHMCNNMHAFNYDNNAKMDENSIRARDDDTRI